MRAVINSFSRLQGRDPWSEGGKELPENERYSIYGWFGDGVCTSWELSRNYLNCYLCCCFWVQLTRVRKLPYICMEYFRGNFSGEATSLDHKIFKLGYNDPQGCNGYTHSYILSFKMNCKNRMEKQTFRELCTCGFRCPEKATNI